MVWYLVGINLLSFVVYGIDKYLAVNNKYRISEYNLFVFAIFGGAMGALLGMKVFHHKTRKLSFWIINIILSVIWVIIVV